MGNYEVFDPYLSSKVKTLELKNITVNEERVQGVSGIVREIEFDDVNGDGRSTARGSIDEIILDGKKVNLK